MAQLQFRSDDTQVWAEKFGSGTNGIKTISSNVNSSNYSNYTNVTAGTSGTTSLTIGTSGNAGFFSNGQPCFIHQTQGTGAGNWELNVIANSNGFDSGGGAITMKYNLSNSYTTGAQIWNLAQFTTFTVNGSQTLSAPTWDGTTGGIIPVFANQSITVTGSINAASSGFRGGSGGTGVDRQGRQGESSSGGGGAGQSANGMGGGGGTPDTSLGDGGGGGGGAGHAATGTAGQANNNGGNGQGGNAGGTGGVAGLTTMFFGAGAGEGGLDDSGNPCVGGAGGGIVFLIAPTITVTGSIVVGGGNGASNGISGGGGGAAGGSILFKGQVLTLGSSLATSAAGSGGTGVGGHAGDGGAGSVGRIHADYLTSISGSTSPTIDSRQDNSLTSPSQGGFFSAFV